MLQGDHRHCHCRRTDGSFHIGGSPRVRTHLLPPRPPTPRRRQLSASAADHSHHTVYFTLVLHNCNKDTGIYYDPLNLNFSYKPPAGDANSSRISAVPVRNAAVPGFHQGGCKDARRNERFVSDGDGWRREAAKAAGKAGFRVDLKMEIRYKIVFWKTKRHRLEVGADVAVDGGGGLILKRGFLKKAKGIKLTSATGALPEGTGVVFWSGCCWLLA